MIERQRLLGMNRILIAGNLLVFASLLMAALVVRGRVPNGSEKPQVAPGVGATKSLPANGKLQTGNPAVIEGSPPKVAKGENASVSTVGAAAGDERVGPC